MSYLKAHIFKDKCETHRVQKRQNTAGITEASIINLQNVASRAESKSMTSAKHNETASAKRSRGHPPNLGH